MIRGPDNDVITTCTPYRDKSLHVSLMAIKSAITLMRRLWPISILRKSPKSPKPNFWITIDEPSNVKYDTTNICICVMSM